MIDIPDSIFPADADGARLCPRCRNSLKACTCPAYDPSAPKTEQFIPSMRLDKSGRRGKVMTVIEGLPADNAYLKDLARSLKELCGCGGTFHCRGQQGVIELQGDRLAKAVILLQKEGYDV